MYPDPNELSNDQLTLLYGHNPGSVLTLTEPELVNEVDDSGNEKGMLSALCGRVDDDKRMCSVWVSIIERAQNDLQTLHRSSSNEEKGTMDFQLNTYLDSVSELKGVIGVFRSKSLFLLNEIQSMRNSLVMPQEAPDNHSVASVPSMLDTPEDRLNLLGVDALQDTRSCSSVVTSASPSEHTSPMCRPTQHE